MRLEERHKAQQNNLLKNVTSSEIRDSNHLYKKLIWGSFVTLIKTLPNPAFLIIMEIYSNKIDSHISQFNDTIIFPIKSCFMNLRQINILKLLLKSKIFVVECRHIEYENITFCIILLLITCFYKILILNNAS